MKALRLNALFALLVVVFFIFVFDLGKHDPKIALGNPFAEDPFDAVGSFGIQLALAGAVIGSVRAFRPPVAQESFGNRTTYTLRALAVAQLSVAVTMLANLTAVIRLLVRGTVWPGIVYASVLTCGLLLISLVACASVIATARHAEVCSQNPLRQSQTVPFVILLALLGVYPEAWRENVAGAILTAGAGTIFLFASVVLLAKAIFPCPDLPERGILEDIRGIFEAVIPRLGFIRPLVATLESHASHGTAPPPAPVRRRRGWLIIVPLALAIGLLLAAIELYGEGGMPRSGRAVLVIAVFVGLESSGILIGYALFRKFLGFHRTLEP